MNSLHNLGRCLGDVSTAAFLRHHHHQSLQTLQHDSSISFNYKSSDGQATSSHIGGSTPSTGLESKLQGVAHQAGTNCLSIDPQTGQYLITGGADSTVRLWDLNRSTEDDPNGSSHNDIHRPVASLSRSQPFAHNHAITSLSVYPFDSVPTTLLTTSYDKTFLLSTITPTSLRPIHSTQLDFTPHTHAVSPHPVFSSPLVAIGTQHPAVRLVDLRTGLATHSLPGHNGAIYALTFHPSPAYPHLLISGGVDGRILLFDIRRANPAFACLDLEDAIGFPYTPFDPPKSYESRAPSLHLDYAAKAHTGPITGLVPVPYNHGLAGQAGLAGSGAGYLMSASHDNRIRLWDLATGANSLVHFGPRIRNSRPGNLSPLVLPSMFAPKSGRDVVLWANDDTRGEIFVHDVHEGTLLDILQTKGIDRSNTTISTSRNRKGHGSDSRRLNDDNSTTTPASGSPSEAMTKGSMSSRRAASKALALSKANATRLTNLGRINQLALRYQASDASTADVLEIYSAHGDGSVCVWRHAKISADDDVDSNTDSNDDDEEESDDPKTNKKRNQTHHHQPTIEDQADISSKKRKRDLIGDLVQGLSKKPITFT